MFRPHFNIVFLVGEEEVSWVNRASEGSIPNLDMQGTFFLTFLSKITALIFLKMTKMCFVYDRPLEASKFTFSFSYENFQIKETVRKNKMHGHSTKQRVSSRFPVWRNVITRDLWGQLI